MDTTQIILALITMVCTITTAWFGYSQKVFERKAEAEIERKAAEADKRRKEDILRAEQENSRRRRHSALIYGELGDLRGDYDACRVYIAQPHPMGDIEKVSIYYEVKRKGVESMRNHIQQLALADIPQFGKDLADNGYLHYRCIDEVRDDVAHTLMHAAGTKQLYVVRLLDKNDDWCGSLFVEYTRKSKVDAVRLRQHMEKVAKDIHLILPEYKE